ncbi:hypothetical protein [Clostridium sp. BJN0001]|uniref:hypothetical protein n=1 Tax=Clostridium sp. BJN0001 TaxID=2930219 RepID=UPI001FD3119C|nr:hypothetical protein [Clostridium sp. BJN0001]
MYNVSQLFKNYAKNTTRNIKLKAEVNDSTIISSNNINSITIEDSICGSCLEIGSTMSSILEIETKSSIIKAGDKVKPYICFADYNGENQSEWMPLGVFFVDSEPQINNSVKYVCYDMMNKLDRIFSSSLTYPTSMQSLLEELAERLNVVVEFTSEPYTIDSKPSGYTYKEILSYIASANCGCAKFNKNGNITIVTFKENDEIIKKKNYNTQKVDVSTFTPGSVRFQINDSYSISRGESEEYKIIKCINPLVTNKIVEEVYIKLINISYNDISLKMRGLPYIETGDIVKVEDSNNTDKYYNVAVMHTKLTFNGGMSVDLESFANKPGDKSTSEENYTRIAKGIWHIPNYIYNSSFARFDENLKPDYWDTDGIVSTAYSAYGDYSLYLTKGQHCFQKAFTGVELVDGSKWASLSTRYSFRILGEGVIKVWIENTNGDKLKLQSSSRDAYNTETGVEVDFEVYDLYWHPEPDYIIVAPNTNVMRLKIECVSGYVYIDGVSAVPGSSLEYGIVFQDGKMCEKDRAYMIDNGNVDAKVGDVWFRTDLEV